MPLEWLFGRRMTPEEMLRKNQRVLNKAMRDLDREKSHMEQQEKKLIAEIKKMAKDGQMVNTAPTRTHLRKITSIYYSQFALLQESVKILARDLVRTRRYQKKFTLMKANIQGVSLKIQTLRSQNAMAGAMRGVTKAMQNMNRFVGVGFRPNTSVSLSFDIFFFFAIRQMNLPQVQRILQEFEKQSDVMDMKEEIMNDAIDEAMADEGDEEET